jgi:hypothetical protein
LNGHHADHEADDRGLGLDRQANQQLNFLDEINRVVPWAGLVTLIKPHRPRTLTEQRRFLLRRRCAFFRHDWFMVGY